MYNFVCTISNKQLLKATKTVPLNIFNDTVLTTDISIGTIPGLILSLFPSIYILTFKWKLGYTKLLQQQL